MKKIYLDILKNYYQWLTGNEAALSKAYQTAKSQYEKHPANINLFLYTVFFAIESGNVSLAAEMLESFKSYIAHYKANDKTVIAVYYFLLAKLDPTQIQKSEALIKQPADNNFIYEQLLCHLHLDTDMAAAYTYLERAYAKGCRSPFLYLAFCKVFETGRRYYRDNLLIGFLRWANTHKILTPEQLEINIHLVKSLVIRDIRLFRKIYLNLEIPWLLEEICKVQVKVNDTSHEAYIFYKDIERKQIYREEFNTGLVYSAYQNRIEDISRFSLEKFIQRNIPAELKPYIYHLLLKDSKFRDLSANLEEDMAGFAFFSVNSPIKAIDKHYYNSVFRFALEYFNKEELSSIENTLYEDLFTYKLTITDPGVFHVWISESAKIEPVSYSREDSIINIASPNFRTLCLDKDKKKIIDHEPILEKQVQNADIWLYEYFYKRNKISLDLLIALSSHYITENTATELAVEVLTRTLQSKGLSRSFRVQLGASLGSVLFSLNHPQKALDYCRNVDESYLDKKYIKMMLLVFMSNKEYDSAVKLIRNNSRHIPEPALFKALQELITQGEELVNSMYELLIKGYYHKDFLQIVLDKYKGSTREWCALSEVLSKGYVYHMPLDVKILDDIIKMRAISEEGEKVFVRLYKKQPENPIISDVIYYFSYEVLKNSFTLQQNTLGVLEEYYNSTKNEIVLLALTKSYIRYPDIKREIIQAGIASLVKTEVFLPFFMDLKDILPKEYQSQTSIVYNGGKDEDVKLAFRDVLLPMKYFKFGIYVMGIPIFYNETIKCTFMVNSRKEEELTVKNNLIYLQPHVESEFFLINNGLMYYELFKYDELENVLDKLFKSTPEFELKTL